jgi:hypothetical protein
MRSLATGKCASHKGRVTFSSVNQCLRLTQDGAICDWQAARPSSSPKSFQPKRDLDVLYAHNMTAWMTAAEFSRWIKGGEVVCAAWLLLC